MHTKLSLLLVAVVALSLAACGGSGGHNSVAAGSKPLTKSQYLEKIRQIETKLQTLMPSDAGSMTKDAAAEGQTALRAFADELSKINPPTAAKKAHADMVAGLRQFADEMPGMFDKASKAKTPSAGMEAIFGAQGFLLLMKASQEFQAAGFKLPTTSSDTTLTTSG